VVIMAHDHPLAAKPILRLRDVLDYEIALPGPSFAGREMVDQILAKSARRMNVSVEANSFALLAEIVRDTALLTLQIEIGALHLKNNPAFAIRQIDDVDLARGSLVLGQLKGRTLPIASAKFAEQLVASLDALRA